MTLFKSASNYVIHHDPTPFLAGLDHGDDVHQFIDLEHGVCHFQLSGPAEGLPLVLIHGATVPMWEFDRILPALHTAGYRTLRFDLYGHGFSARPQCSYTLALFSKQLHQLLTYVGFTQPIHILGHSLGAAVAANLAATRTHRIQHIVLAAPLVDFTEQMRLSRLLNHALMGRLLVHALVVPMLRRRRRLRYRQLADGQFALMFERQLAVPGFARALHSLFQHGTLGNQQATYYALRGSTLRLSMLRGELDDIVSLEQIVRLQAWLPQAETFALKDAGHPFMLTHPEAATQLICRALHRD